MDDGAGDRPGRESHRRRHDGPGVAPKEPGIADAPELFGPDCSRVRRGPGRWRNSLVTIDDFLPQPIGSTVPDSHFVSNDLPIGVQSGSGRPRRQSKAAELGAGFSPTSFNRQQANRQGKGPPVPIKSDKKPTKKTTMTNRIFAGIVPNRRSTVLSRLLSLCFAAVTLLAAASLTTSVAKAAPAPNLRGFNRPGNILISDQFNNRVIEVDPAGHIVWSFGWGRMTSAPIQPSA